MNKEIILKTSVAFILFVLLSLGLYAFISKKDNKTDHIETNIPQIKENYTSTELTKYIEFNDKIKIMNNKFIIKNNEEEYYMSYNNNSLQYQKVNEIKINKNYTIQTNENNKKYIINNSNNTISDSYDSIEEITFNNETYSYLLVSNNNKYSLIDLETNELIELDEEISYIEDLYKYNDNKKEIISNKYIKVKNNDKYGIIDYEGNIIIEIKYDDIEIANDTFIVKNNNKYGVLNNSNEILIEINYEEIKQYNNNYLIKNNNKYGIIDKNKNILYNLEIDYVELLNEFILVIKNNKLGIIKDNKLILNYEIETQNNRINSYILNNEIYINTYINNEIKTYIIKDDKIKKIIDSELKQIDITDYNTDEENTEKDNKYTYTINKNNNSFDLYIYDENYNKYYEHNTKLDINLQEYDVYMKLTKNHSNNYYKLTLTLMNDTITKYLYYYYDIDKKSVMNEKDALRKYLENGYSFTLNNDELKIYKNDQLINTHLYIEYYIGGYFFSNKDGIVYKLEFKNESNN